MSLWCREKQCKELALLLLAAVGRKEPHCQAALLSGSSPSLPKECRKWHTLLQTPREKPVLNDEVLLSFDIANVLKNEYIKGLIALNLFFPLKKYKTTSLKLNTH